MKQRNKKKLLAKTTWFREKRKRDADDDEDELEEIKLPARKRRAGEKQKDGGDAGKIAPDVKAVMFVPFTAGSKLAKSLRDAEEKLGSITGYRLKIVEKAGDKLVDLLTKSNPWQGMDCGRDACLLCKTKLKTERNLTQDCHTRNLVYETCCMTCLKKDEEEVERKYEGDARKMKEMKGKIRMHLYVGETSRSMYERALEHQGDVEQLKTSSHMLRHLVEMHGGEERSKVEFGVKVLRYTRSSFERQILESVLIQSKRSHHIMNNRAEFNRCAIPRLVTKLGERELKQWREEDKEMQNKEERVEEQIRMMKKERNRNRAGIQRKAPNPKRQKLDEDGERSQDDQQVRKQWIIPETEKRKWGEKEEKERCMNEPKRLKKDDIRFFMKCSTEGQAEHD